MLLMPQLAWQTGFHLLPCRAELAAGREVRAGEQLCRVTGNAVDSPTTRGHPGKPLSTSRCP